MKTVSETRKYIAGGIGEAVVVNQLHLPSSATTNYCVLNIPQLLSSYHQQQHRYDSSVWATAFLRTDLNYSVFHSTPPVSYAQNFHILPHASTPSRSGSSHFHISFWFSIKYFLNLLRKYTNIL